MKLDRATARDRAINGDRRRNNTTGANGINAGLVELQSERRWHSAKRIVSAGSGIFGFHRSVKKGAESFKARTSVS